MCVCVCIYIYMYIYVCIYIRIYYLNTYLYVSVSSSSILTSRTVVTSRIEQGFCMNNNTCNLFTVVINKLPMHDRGFKEFGDPHKQDCSDMCVDLKEDRG